MPRATNPVMEDIEAAEPVSAPASVHHTAGEAMPRRSRRKLASLITLIVALLGVLGTIYFYHQYSVLKKNPNAQQQAELAALVKEVSAIILLPDETPTVATVLDTKALVNQPFFAQAQNGDKVMVFAGAKQAILYRPSVRKIINVAPLYFQDAQESSVQTEPVPVVAPTADTGN